MIHKKNTGRKIAIIFFSFLFLVGFGLFLYPYINGAILNWKAAQSSQSFLLLQEYVPEASETFEPILPYSELRNDIEAYNKQIFEENQSKLRNNGDFEKPSFILADYGLDTEVFAVISIPKLELELPVYLGASLDNLSLGTAHMSQTSLPIGGKNTNCIIAGHRGWKGAAYFKNLPDLEVGDEISITNLWETLNYKVVDTKVIFNTESKYVYIQEDRDLVTLLTCTYSPNGVRYRYIVICERILDE